jgi:HAD superfamily hydrolase (TIGR01549 family)
MIAVKRFAKPPLILRRGFMQLKQFIAYDAATVRTGDTLQCAPETIRAVIFDIDGTLVDSVDLHAEAWQRAFQEFGKKVSFVEVRRQIGKSGDQLLPVFLSPTELEKFGKELEEYRSDLYKREYLPRVKPFSQVRELFERIRQDGKRIALASSAKEEELETYKKIAQIDHLIQAATSSDDAEKSKPHPDIFQAALKDLNGIAPDRAIVVGDTPYDAMASAGANLRAIGILCGGWSENDLRKAGCIAIYQNPEDLLERYDRSPLGRVPWAITLR